MTTSSETKAREGIEGLVADLKNARAEEAFAKSSLRIADERIRRLEDQIYGRYARAITSFMSVEHNYSVGTRAHRLVLHPKTHSLVIPAMDIEYSRAPIQIIHDRIDGIVKMHADDIRKQLRDSMWDLCR
jgi:hypothetical protein